MTFTPTGLVTDMNADVTHVESKPSPESNDRAAGRDPLESLARALLVEIGEDPDREGLRETPARYARWWREFVGYDAGQIETTFDAVTAGQVIQACGIRVWSLCEHHLLPFWCDVSIAYIAHHRIIGLSKFARIAQDHAHRLQVQERLTVGIADSVAAVSGSPDVAVHANGEHLCMTMRGVRTPATMSTSVYRGVFLDDPDMRAMLDPRR